MALRQGRSGHTRRERNRALYATVIGVVVVIVGLSLLVASRVDPSRGGALRTAALETTAPVWGVLRIPAAWVSGAIAGIDDYFGAISRNRRRVRKRIKLDQRLRSSSHRSSEPSCEDHTAVAR